MTRYWMCTKICPVQLLEYVNEPHSGKVGCVSGERMGRRVEE
jgi:hypothetical protein